MTYDRYTYTHSWLLKSTTHCQKIFSQQVDQNHILQRERTTLKQNKLIEHQMLSINSLVCCCCVNSSVSCVDDTLLKWHFFVVVVLFLRMSHTHICVFGASGMMHIICSSLFFCVWCFLVFSIDYISNFNVKLRVVSMFV